MAMMMLMMKMIMTTMMTDEMMMMMMLREALKKIRDYLGIFPKRRTPPHTPLLGISTTFYPIFVGQVEHFWVILRYFKGFLGLWLK